MAQGRGEIYEAYRRVHEIRLKARQDGSRPNNMILDASPSPRPMGISSIGGEAPLLPRTDDPIKMKAKMDAFEKQLSKIVGLKSLKAQLRSWANQMMLDVRRRALGLQMGDIKLPHMAFLGNPGTGKTTVARMLGELLHMLGVITSNKVVEVQRSDLVAQYVGQTGPLTRRKIKEAKGGILFVDEAYRLVPNKFDHSNDFGLEVLVAEKY